MSFYDVLLAQSLNGNGGGGSTVTVDTQMSDTSTNPVQNKVIKEYVDDSKGYEVTETVCIPQQSFTGSESYGAYVATLTGTYPTSDTIKVVLDGTEYTVSKNDAGGYGSSGSFDEYPFGLYYENDILIYVADGNQHTVKVSESAMSVDSDFKNAVMESLQFFNIWFDTHLHEFVCNRTFDELSDAATAFLDGSINFIFCVFNGILSSSFVIISDYTGITGVKFYFTYWGPDNDNENRLVKTTITISSEGIAETNTGYILTPEN